MDLIIRTKVDDSGTTFFKFYLNDGLNFEQEKVFEQIAEHCQLDEKEVVEQEAAGGTVSCVYCVEGDTLLYRLDALNDNQEIFQAKLCKFFLKGFDEEDASCLRSMGYDGKNDNDLLANYLNSTISDIRYYIDKAINGKTKPANHYHRLLLNNLIKS